MLVTKVTKTMNVDIWNFWHYTFTSNVIEYGQIFGKRY
ncbi:hypothetical protein ACVXZ0_12700 [Staphylococcus aureus]